MRVWDLTCLTSQESDKQLQLLDPSSAGKACSAAIEAQNGFPKRCRSKSQNLHLRGTLRIVECARGGSNGAASALQYARNLRLRRRLWVPLTNHVAAGGENQPKLAHGVHARESCDQSCKVTHRSSLHIALRVADRFVHMTSRVFLTSTKLPLISLKCTVILVFTVKEARSASQTPCRPEQCAVWAVLKPVVSCDRYWPSWISPFAWVAWILEACRQHGKG